MMNFAIDARIPLVFGDRETATGDDALLQEGSGPASQGWFAAEPERGDVAGCACCAPRNAAGIALGRLLLGRGRGTRPFFRRVVVVTCTQAGHQAVIRALATDPLVRHSFREEK